MVGIGRNLVPCQPIRADALDDPYAFVWGMIGTQVRPQEPACVTRSLVTALAPLSLPSAPALAALRLTKGYTTLFTIGQKKALPLNITEHTFSLDFFAEAFQQLFWRFARSQVNGYQLISPPLSIIDHSDQRHGLYPGTARTPVAVQVQVPERFAQQKDLGSPLHHQRCGVCQVQHRASNRMLPDPVRSRNQVRTGTSCLPK
jgi:hypothetical protein